MSALEIKTFRVLALPEVGERVLGAQYLIRDAATGDLTLHVVGKDDATQVTSTISRTAIAQMITEATSEEAVRLVNTMTLESTEVSDVSASFSFRGDEGTVTSAMTLRDVQVFEEGVTTAEYFKTITDAKGRVVGGQTALLEADIPDLSGSKITSELSVDTSGTAATATALETARTIAGHTFDGTQDVVITADDVGAVARTDIGTTVPPLVDGLVPAAFLPQYVDDVIEVSSYDELPGMENDLGTNGAADKGKIYLVVEPQFSNPEAPEEVTGHVTKVYRFGGSVYVQIVDGVSMADQAMRLADPRTLAMTGDGTWQVLFDGSENVTAAFTLADTGVAAGDYGFFTVDSKGRLTQARALVAADIPELDYTTVRSAASVVTENAAW